jgi:anti-sigma regulatory factor (Ser/Thr protein kinase)
VTSIELLPERSAASHARRYIREIGTSWGLSADDIADLELLASELVTNAVLHARSGARLTIEDRGDRVRVTISDASRVRPRRRDYGSEAITGRGIVIVDRLSHDWGVELDDDGKHVWFELLRTHTNGQGAR